MLIFVITHLLFDLISTGLANNLFVGKSDCSAIDCCSGTKENPYPYLIDALEKVSNRNYSENESIIIILVDQNIDIANNSEYKIPDSLFVTSIDKGLNLEITSYDNISYSQIKFLDGKYLSFNILNGKLKFSNILFIGDYENPNLEFEIDTLLQSHLPRGFFNIQAKNDSLLALGNCKFVGTIKIPGGEHHRFLALIFAENNNEAITTRISIEKVEFLDQHYPQGVIHTNGTMASMLGTHNLSVTLKSIKFQNYRNYFFLHWNNKSKQSANSEDYYDFAIIINNSALSMEDVSLTNTSRFLLADCRNAVFLEDLSYFNENNNKHIPNDLPPELLYFINFNKVTLKKLRFYNLSVFTFDDMVNINSRDSKIFESMDDLSILYIMDFERGQSLIKFGISNNADLSDIKVVGGTFFRKANLLFNFIHLEIKNTLSINDMLVRDVFMDTDSKIGGLAFFKFEADNSFEIKNFIAINIEGYSYSSLIFFYGVFNNSVSLLNVSFNNTIFKSKSNKRDLTNFSNFIIKSNITLAFLKMEYIKCLSYGGFTFKNKIIIENSYMFDLFCLYGCLINMFGMNYAKITNSQSIYISSEILSSYVLLAFNNSLVGTRIFVSFSRSLNGIFHFHSLNSVNLNECLINSSWAQGGFDFFEYYSAGVQTLIERNNIQIKKTIIEAGKSDIMAGAITAGLTNIILIWECKFQNMKSANAASDAGVMYFDRYNKLTVINSDFYSNYGNYGGVAMANNSNDIQFFNCSLIENYGIQGSLIFSIFNNSINFSASSIILNVGYNDGGILILKNDFQKLFIHNCSLIENETPFDRGALLMISSSNIFIIENVILEYGGRGAGDFCSIMTSNTLLLFNLTIKNSFKLFKVLKTDFKNRITIKDFQFWNSTLEGNLINLNEENILNISDILIFNIEVKSPIANMLWALNRNVIIIKNFLFFNTSSFYYLFFLVRDNHLSINQLNLDLILFYSGGTLIRLNQGNHIMINNSNFNNFEGVKNDVFLIDFEKENSILLQSVKMRGSFKYDQGEYKSTLLKFNGRDNTFTAHNWSIIIVNPLMKSSYLSLIAMEGGSNILKVSLSAFKIQNLTSIIETNYSNRVSLNEILLYECELLSDFFIFRNVKLNLTNTIFYKNFVGENYYLIKLLNKSDCLAKRITLASNNNFVFLSQSTIILNTSKIDSCKKKSNLQEPGKILNLENFSFAFIYRGEILCRYNQNESNVISFQSELKIELSLIGFNEALKGGFGKIDMQSNITLLKNYFFFNRAYMGGVFNLINYNFIKISGNFFIFNRAFRYSSGLQKFAPAKGGCFFVHQRGKEFYMNFTNNYIFLNGAEIGGVIFLMETNKERQEIPIPHLELKELKLAKTKFYGTFWASNPVLLFYIKGDDLNNNRSEKHIVIEEKINPGKNMTHCAAQILVSDIFEQIAYGGNNLKQTNFTLKGVQVFFKIYNDFPCLYKITPLTLTALTTFAEQPLIFQFNTGQFFRNNSFVPIENYSFSFQFRKCVFGEYFDMNSYQCIECEANFFSFQNDFLVPSSCHSCFDMPFNCYGGFNLSPKPSFWRRSQVSTNFIKCPIEKACLGDTMVDETKSKFSVLYINPDLMIPTGICSVGYRGILCNKCSKGYSKIDGMKCSLCDNWLSLAFIISKISIKIFLIIYMIMKALTFCKNIKKNLISLGLVYSNFMIKIMILHLQFIRAFFKFPFSLPEYFEKIFSFFTLSISSGINKAMNLDCYINFTNFNEEYINSLLTIIGPIFFVILTTIFVKMARLLRKRSSDLIIPESTERRRSSSGIAYLFKDSFLFYLIIICIMLSYDEIVSKLMENFSFINVNDNNAPEFRIISNFEIDYFSSSHQKWIKYYVAPMSLFIGFFIPFFIFINIVIGKRQGLLKDVRFLCRFGYFIFAYENGQLYYEFQYTFRRILLIAIDIFFISGFTLSNNNNPLTYMIIMCFVFTISTVRSQVRPPYNHEKYPKLNQIETIFLLVQSIMCWSGSFLLSLNQEQNRIFYEIIRLAFYLVLLISNIIVLSVWIYFYWKLSVKEKLSYMIRKIKTKMKSMKKSTAKLNTRSQSNSLFNESSSRKNALKSVKIFEGYGDQNSPSNLKKKFYKQNALNNTIEDLEKLVEELKAENESLRMRLELNSVRKSESYDFARVDVLDHEDETPIPIIKVSNPVFDKYLNKSGFLRQQQTTKIYIDKTKENLETNISNLVEQLFSPSQPDTKILHDQEPFKVLIRKKQIEGSKFKGFYLAIDLVIQRKQGLFSMKDLMVHVPSRENFFIGISETLLSIDENDLFFSLKLQYDSLQKLKAFENFNIEISNRNNRSTIINIPLEINCFDFLARSSLQFNKRICSQHSLNMESMKDDIDNSMNTVYYLFPGENFSLELTQSKTEIPQGEEKGYYQLKFLADADDGPLNYFFPEQSVPDFTKWLNSLKISHSYISK